MVLKPPPANPPSTRRERDALRRDGRRNAAKRVVYGVLIAVVIVLVVLFATDTIAIRGKRPQLHSSAANAAPSNRPSVAAANDEDIRNLAGANSVRPLSHDAPLRVWMGGDSHMGTIGRSLGRQLGATGVVAPKVDYKVGSGLVSGSRDWAEYVPEQLAKYQPEVVAFMVGTNDAVVFDDSMAGRYRLKVAEMMDVLAGDGGRTVYWMGTPPLRDEGDNENVKELNFIARDEASKRDAVVYVDVASIVDDGEGNWTSEYERSPGDTVRIRAGDGVHFTDSGYELVGSVMYLLFDEQFQLGRQSVPDQPIDFEYTSTGGCGSSGCSRSRSSTGSSSGSGRRYSSPTTSVDTAPDTAPATTSTPDTTVYVPPTTVFVPPSTTTPAPPTTVSPPPTSSPGKSGSVMGGLL